MSTLNARRLRNSVRDTIMPTYEGGVGRKAGAEEELALLSLTTFLGDRFYETSTGTLDRMYKLVQDVRPEFVTQLARVARQEFNMRATPAALIGFHLLAHGQPDDGRVIRDVFFRGDEIGDTLAVTSRYSDNRKVIPSAVRFARRVLQSNLSQRSALRYANSSREWSLEKIVRLSHARQDATPEQLALFNFVLRRHSEGSLSKAWEATPEEDKAILTFIGATVAGEDEGASGWERARSAGASWRELVPTMGYMALLRNLRNFMEDASLASDREFWNDVCGRLSNKEEVANSKQLPFRFFSAYRNLPANHRYYGAVSQAVSDALDASIGNLPRLEGRTLIIVDTSASMTWSTVSGMSEVTPSDIANLFGAAMYQSQDADVIAFASYAAWVPLNKTDSILSNAARIRKTQVGGGTALSQALTLVGSKLNEYDNVVIFSDMQISGEASFKGYRGNVFAVNLVAYEAQLAKTSAKYYSIGGWSDATLKLMSLLTSRSLTDYINRY